MATMSDSDRHRLASLRASVEWRERCESGVAIPPNTEHYNVVKLQRGAWSVPPVVTIKEADEVRRDVSACDKRCDKRRRGEESGIELLPLVQCFPTAAVPRKLRALREPL